MWALLFKALDVDDRPRTGNTHPRLQQQATMYSAPPMSFTSPKSCPSPHHHVMTQQKTLTQCQHLDPGLPSLQKWENKMPVITNNTLFGMFHQHKGMLTTWLIPATEESMCGPNIWFSGFLKCEIREAEGWRLPFNSPMALRAGLEPGWTQLYVMVLWKEFVSILSCQQKGCTLRHCCGLFNPRIAVAGLFLLWGF